MRRIKFRAWDNVTNQFYFLGEESNVLFSFDSNGILAEDLTEHDWGFKKLEHLVYTQYTGLKDTNGKEIYEGDFLHYHIEEYPGGHYREREEKRIIEFVDGCFWLVSKNGDEPLYAVHAADDELKTMGNIYENPKLLEESK